MTPGEMMIWACAFERDVVSALSKNGISTQDVACAVEHACEIVSMARNYRAISNVEYPPTYDAKNMLREIIGEVPRGE